MKIRKPGEIWLADLGLAAKPRPVLVVSRADPDPPRVLYIYVPLTTQYRESQYEVALGKLPFMHAESAANVQGIGSIPDARFIRKLGQLPSEKLEAVKEAILFAIDH
jgi:mRNA interferase MazF